MIEDEMIPEIAEEEMIQEIVDEEMIREIVNHADLDPDHVIKIIVMTKIVMMY
jgi:rhamnose utilization protein RhaD (predicted bifunctional aldolase and dehydrogenase)